MDDPDRQRALPHVRKAHAEMMKARAILSNDALWDDAAGVVEEINALIRKMGD